MSDSEFAKEERPSKSQRKREMTALQKLGELLVKLSENELNQIPIDSDLLNAIITARGLKNNEAKRRQLQYIGRLMREVDPKPIEEAISKLQLKHKQVNAQFHELEHYRDKLISSGDDALQEVMTEFPQADRQQLRQLIRAAQQGKKGADTKLFRFLRDMMG